MLPTPTIDVTWMLLVLLPAVVQDMDASSPLQSVICKREKGMRLFMTSNQQKNSIKLFIIDK